MLGLMLVFQDIGWTETIDLYDRLIKENPQAWKSYGSSAAAGNWPRFMTYLHPVNGRYEKVRR